MARMVTGDSSLACLVGVTTRPGRCWDTGGAKLLPWLDIVVRAESYEKIRTGKEKEKEILFSFTPHISGVVREYGLLLSAKQTYIS